MESEEISIIVPPDLAGTRLDTFLVGKIQNVSRSIIQRAIENGDCLVNEQRVKSSYKVRTADEIQFEFPDLAPLEALPENISLDIIYEDDEVIVINKPAGMVVHPGAGISTGTLANALVYHFSHLSNRNSIRPGIVHRLDVGTSGVIIVAKSERTHQCLAKQFETRSIEKSYLALVYGQVRESEGIIDAPIGRDPRNRVKMSVRPLGQGRNALSLYRVIERYTEFTLLEVQIKTGRTHQIRVHLASVNHPIASDQTYDKGRLNAIKKTELRAAIARLGRPFLHAHYLSFIHPNGERMSFRVPLPPELFDLVQNYLTPTNKQL